MKKVWLGSLGSTKFPKETRPSQTVWKFVRQTVLLGKDSLKTVQLLECWTVCSSSLSCSYHFYRIQMKGLHVANRLLEDTGLFSCWTYKLPCRMECFTSSYYIPCLHKLPWRMKFLSHNKWLQNIFHTQKPPVPWAYDDPFLLHSVIISWDLRTASSWSNWEIIYVIKLREPWWM